MATNGECVPCNGACPKTCPGQGIVHSGNIESFRGCTVIEGSLEILEQTFNGYQHVFANFSFGPRFIRLNPDRLEVFSTLKEVTGFINIQAYHESFTNLVLPQPGGDRRPAIDRLCVALYRQVVVEVARVEVTQADQFRSRGHSGEQEPLLCGGDQLCQGDEAVRASEYGHQ